MDSIADNSTVCIDHADGQEGTDVCPSEGAKLPALSPESQAGKARPVHTSIDLAGARPYLEELLAHVIRNPAVYEIARSSLGIANFDSYCMDLRCLWERIGEAVRDYGRDILAGAELKFILEDRLSKGSASERRLLKTGLISEAFASPAELFTTEKGRWLLQQATYQTNLVQPLQLLATDERLVDRDPKDVLASLATIIERATVATTAEASLFMSPEEFATAEFKLDWLIPKVLVAGQPCIVGGPSKAMKTGTMIDLAISIGAGSKAAFLGHFPVKHDGKRVGFISGESGGATIQETFKRVCLSRGVKLEKCNVYPEFRLPKLSQAAELRNLASQVKARDLQVLIIDPVYLSLLAGNTTAKAMNLFDMGPLLSNVTQTCLEAGATPILVHHTVKRPGSANGFTGQFEPIDREDLAMSGFSEFARQWLLINRREAYVDGTGSHELWLRVGGSVGFGGLYAVTIDEGTIGEDFTGRTWNVRVTSADKVRQERARKKGELKLAKAEEKRQGEKVRLIGALLHFPDGQTATSLRDTALLSKNVGVVALLDELVHEGLAERTTIQKPAGRGPRPQAAYKPSWRAGAYYSTLTPAAAVAAGPGGHGTLATNPRNDIPALDLAV